ncbi:MAG TPA: hypothetical protein VLE49_13410, partial [Anaerolineales bacterium]|nr:hypothetical protein [Anaerolineales bacterium]
MKKIKLFNPGGQPKAGLQYLLLDYRQKLLQIALAMCILVGIGLTIVNLIDLIRDPFAEWGIYNLITDGIALVI